MLTGERVEHRVGGDVAGLTVGWSRVLVDDTSTSSSVPRRSSSSTSVSAAPALASITNRWSAGSAISIRRSRQASGGVDRAVDRSDAAFGLVEGAAHRGRIGDVGHDDRDLRAARLQLAQLADPARRRVVVGVGGEPAVAHRARRHVVGGEQHEVGLVLGRQVRREDAADTAERRR